jgi:hypothetical protein
MDGTDMMSRRYKIASVLWTAMALILLEPRSSAQTSVPVSTSTPESNVISPSRNQNLEWALNYAQACLAYSNENIHDYTAILTKRCRENGVLSESQHISVKIRHRREEAGRKTVPMSVYMNFLKPDGVKGREVIWVEGQNNGNMVAHEGGLKNVLTVNLAPSGSMAMRGQRYPVTEVGMKKLIEKMLEKGMRERQLGDCEVNLYRDVAVGTRKCTAIEIVHPVAKPQFEFHRAQLFFDDEHKMPIRYVSWLWPSSDGQPVLDEEYYYSNVKTNVGLTDSDFDPKNSAYKFW